MNHSQSSLYESFISAATQWIAPLMQDHGFRPLQPIVPSRDRGVCHFAFMSVATGIVMDHYFDAEGFRFDVAVIEGDLNRPLDGWQSYSVVGQLGCRKAVLLSAFLAWKNAPPFTAKCLPNCSTESTFRRSYSQRQKLFEDSMSEVVQCIASSIGEIGIDQILSSLQHIDEIQHNHLQRFNLSLSDDGRYVLHSLHRSPK